MQKANLPTESSQEISDGLTDRMIQLQMYADIISQKLPISIYADRQYQSVSGIASSRD